MNEQLRIRLGAVVLALLTIAAIIFAGLNFQQRSLFVVPDDGVTWMDAPAGVVAWHVVPGGPGDRAGIRQGDYVETVRDQAVDRATDVSRVLWRLGPWAQVNYAIRHDGQTLQVPLITAPQENPSSIENYLRVTALLYLFIGLFIFLRRWTAARAVHFYFFCLVSFVLYMFHYSGKLNSFDWTIYWGNVAAWMLQPALLVHFALVFPERRGTLWPKLLALYSIPAVLLTLHVCVATGTFDFLPSIIAREKLDQMEIVYLGCYFLLAAGTFLASYLRAPSGVLRQQLKWVTGGTFAGILPFFLLYVLPGVAGAAAHPWMKMSVFSLALIPLCFGYAVIRYRLMDVDIIFKRGLAYTFATAAIVALYFGTVALISEFFHTAWATGPAGVVVAIVVAAFLFEPVRNWTQIRLDKFFYRDRLDYRRTLIEFGVTLTNEVRLEPLLGSILDRISQTLLVDRLAIFLEDPSQPGHFVLSRSMGGRPEGPLDLSFLDVVSAQSCLFFESTRT